MVDTVATVTSGRPYLGSHVRPLSPFGRVVLLGEPPTSDAAWLFLRGYRDDPDRGRALFQGTRASRNQQWREFASYLRQGETYFRGAQTISGSSGALLYYYAALNLAKAEIMVHAPAQLAPGQRVGHGLSTRWGGSATADRLLVRDGVFPILYRLKVGRVLSREPLAIMRLLRNVPEIGFELVQSGESSQTTHAYHSVVYDRDFAWSLLAMSWDAPFLANEVSRRALTRAFRPVDQPEDWVDTFGFSSPFGRRRLRFFESPQLHARRDSRGQLNPRTLEEVCRDTSDLIRPFAGEATIGEGEALLAPSLYKARLRPMPPALARYAVMFYASEVVRYRPARFDSMQNGRTAWLIDAFTPQAALRGLLSSLCAIDRAIYQFHSLAALR